MTGLLLALALALQGAPAREIPVESCPLADSMIGPMHVPGHVLARYNANTDTSQITVIEHGQLVASLKRQGRSPTVYATPAIAFLLDADHGGAALLRAGRRPRVVLVVNDTGRFDLGMGLLGQYSGPEWLAQAPVEVLTTPLAALALARARHARVEVDRYRLSLGHNAIRSYAWLYRAALCNTLPALSG